MSRAANKEKETAAERHGEENKNKSKERKGEDKKERRREAGGKRARGGKREEKEKNERRMGTWSPDRNRLERRGHDGGKERQEQGEVGTEDKEDKSQGERGEGEADRADLHRRRVECERQGRHEDETAAARKSRRAVKESMHKNKQG